MRRGVWVGDAADTQTHSHRQRNEQPKSRTTDRRLLVRSTHPWRNEPWLGALVRPSGRRAAGGPCYFSLTLRPRVDVFVAVFCSFRVGTINGHRSRARRAALRLALRRAHGATSFCHLERFCHLKPFCHLVSPRRVATTRPPTHTPVATRRRGWRAHPTTARHLGLASRAPCPTQPPTPYYFATLQVLI